MPSRARSAGGVSVAALAGVTAEPLPSSHADSATSRTTANSSNVVVRDRVISRLLSGVCRLDATSSAAVPRFADAYDRGFSRAAEYGRERQQGTP
jgi:hypothetical protein